MSNSIQLSVPRPCAEAWSRFRPTEKGAWCGTCQKEVVDFTSLADSEIVRQLTGSGPVCGRFRQDQLKSYPIPFQDRSLRVGWKLAYAGVLALLMSITAKSLVAAPLPFPSMATTEIVQSSSIVQPPHRAVILKGRVRSQEDNSALPGVNVYLKGSAVGTVTDAEGRFEFPQPLNAGDVIIFSFVGLRKEEYVVPEQLLADLEIRMEMEYEVMLGEVAVLPVDDKQPVRKHWWNRLRRR